MFLHKKQFFFLSLPFLLLSISGFFPVSDSDSDSDFDLTKLIFRGCAAQKYPDPTGAFSQNIKALFNSLTSQSSAGNHFSSATSGDGQNTVKGLYQCRGDLSGELCEACVSKLPSLADKLCGRTGAVRVQLAGCYLRYEAAWFAQPPATQFLYKVCGSGSAGGGFPEKRTEALEMVVSGLKNGSSGAGDGLFYTGRFRDVYVLGQCEGGLGGEDCRSCVKTAAESVGDSCGSSVSGQIYLSRCYVSYSFYRNGVPETTSSGTSSGSGHKHTQRTIAIVLGGIAAVGFLIACLMFARSVMKKKHSRSKHIDRY